MLWRVGQKHDDRFNLLFRSRFYWKLRSMHLCQFMQGCFSNASHSKAPARAVISQGLSDITWS